MSEPSAAARGELSASISVPPRPTAGLTPHKRSRQQTPAAAASVESQAEWQNDWASAALSCYCGATNTHMQPQKQKSVNIQEEREHHTFWWCNSWNEHFMCLCCVAVQVMMMGYFSWHGLRKPLNEISELSGWLNSLCQVPGKRKNRNH